MKKWLSFLLTAVLLCCAILPASAAPAADAPVMDGATLVTFGDSLTALSTWPRSVATALNMHLVNSGIGGNTTNDAAARFERDVAAHDPDFVIMCFGTNDFYRVTALGDPKVDVTTYAANLTAFVNDVRALGAEPILMTPPFISEAASGGASHYPEGSVNAALDVYVTAMRDVAATNNVGLIDIHTVCDNYNVSEFLIADGVHLSEQGNTVYAEQIVAYMTANYNQDPSAPRVEQPVAPEAEAGAWTKSLVPFTEDGWLNIYPDTMTVTEETNGAISFANTNGLWPEIHYSPLIENTIAAPVEGSYLTLDIDFEAGSNIILFFNGPTPTLAYANTYLSLTAALAEAVPHLQTSGDDIVAGQTVQTTLMLEDIIPASFIADDGTILFSGVKVFAVGEAGKKVTIHELSVTTTDGTTPAVPEYEDVASLLPESTAVIAQNDTQNGGVVDFALNSDRSLMLSRAASSTLAWPSVKVTCNTAIDLSETPYLHLKVTTISGFANGYIYYTTSTGTTGMVQISYLLDGTVNDITQTTDVYVDLAKAIGTTRTITVTAYTLSVYGEAEATILWNTISTARDASNDAMPGDTDGDNTLTTADAMYTLQHSLGIITLEGKDLKAADYDGNGIINTADARDILRATL